MICIRSLFNACDIFLKFAKVEIITDNQDIKQEDLENMVDLSDSAFEQYYERPGIPKEERVESLRSGFQSKKSGNRSVVIVKGENGKIIGYIYGAPKFVPDMFNTPFFESSDKHNVADYVDDIRKANEEGGIFEVEEIAIDKNIESSPMSVLTMLRKLIGDVRAKGFKYMTADCLKDSFRLFVDENGNIREKMLKRFGLEYLGKVERTVSTETNYVYFKVV